MAEPQRFPKAKLICGLIWGKEEVFREAGDRLVEAFGSIDLVSPAFAFDCTSYYGPEMGSDLKRTFMSFARLIAPDMLSQTKLITNGLERDFARPSGRIQRVVNIDPGILTASALIMATAKNFSHRVPLRDGIYAHLEFLFAKTGLRFLDWTYPDFRKPEYQKFFLEARRTLLSQTKTRCLA